MKIAITRILSLAIIILTLAAPCLGQYENNFCLSGSGFTEYGAGCLEGAGDQVHTLFLLLETPINPDFDSGETRVVEWVSGFECKLEISGDAQLVGWRFPVPAIEFGHYGSVIVGFGEPIQVGLDGSVVLAYLDIQFGGPEKLEGEKLRSPYPCDEAIASLNLVPSQPSSLTGAMAYLDADDPNDPIVAAQGVGLFWFEPAVVGVNEATWGHLKAVFR